MFLARVIGNVVATQKNIHLTGRKLLLIQPIDEKGIGYGSDIIAVDDIGAGIGDLVVAIAEGGAARDITKAENPLAPIDVCITGIIDKLNYY